MGLPGRRRPLHEELLEVLARKGGEPSRGKRSSKFTDLSEQPTSPCGLLGLVGWERSNMLHAGLSDDPRLLYSGLAKGEIEDEEGEISELWRLRLYAPEGPPGPSPDGRTDLP